jgi:hypothetical protein
MHLTLSTSKTGQIPSFRSSSFTPDFLRFYSGTEAETDRTGTLRLFTLGQERCKFSTRHSLRTLGTLKQDQDGTSH